MASNDQNRDRLLDHEVDGIKEFDNNLPRWWLYGFYLTIIWSVVYIVNYHVLQDGQTQKNEYEAEVAQAAQLYKNAPKATSGKATLLTDAASLAKGKEIFTGTNNLCYTCHKADGGGMVGPNLTDDYWIHGCSLEQIMKNITTGFPEKGMLPYGSNNKLTDEQLLQVASYVISLHGTNPPDPKPIDPEREKKCDPAAPSAETSAVTPSASSH